MPTFDEQLEQLEKFAINNELYQRSINLYIKVEEKISRAKALELSINRCQSLVNCISSKELDEEIKEKAKMYHNWIQTGVWE